MIEITDLNHNACGIGRLNNKVVFVRNSLPGDIIEIKILNEKKNYVNASISKIIKKSVLRIESPCPYFDKCGGCDLLNLGYKDQLKFKYNKVNNIMKKYLKNQVKINNIIESNNSLNYRSKVTFQVKDELGFYNNGSYNIVPINRCIISDEKINDSIKYLKQLDLKNISKITCKTNKNDLMIIIETNNENLNTECLKNYAKSIYIKTKDKINLVYGDEYIIQSIGKYKYLVSPDSFFQINLDVCEKLYNKIKEYVGINKNVLDLYCGTGSIGIFVSENNNVLGIEINNSAIKDAKKNIKLNNIECAEFICGDSGKKIYNLNFKPDIVIVDPPRAGLDKITIQNIIKLNPEKIIYVSCDPMTLARDLNCLSDKYNIDEITPFDMFPNTYHVECVCNLINKIK